MKTHLTVVALLALTATACKDEPGGNDAGQQPPLPFISDPLRADAGCDWGQWGQNWAHTGQSCVSAQGFARALATITVDPFVPLRRDGRVHGLLRAGRTLRPLRLAAGRSATTSTWW